MSDNEPVPHVLSAMVNRWGELHFSLTCPYHLGDKRPCTLGVEPKRCDWEDYNRGVHWDGCPTAKDREAECIAAADSQTGCWPAEPPECDGFYGGEAGHVHPAEGCWAQELISELDWSEAVRWEPKIEAELRLPVDVAVTCEEEAVILALWTDPEPSAPSMDDSREHKELA